MDREIYVYEKGIGTYDDQPFLYRFTFINEDVDDIFAFIDDCHKRPVGKNVTYQITTTYKEEYWNGKQSIGK